MPECLSPEIIAVVIKMKFKVAPAFMPGIDNSQHVRL
jgi:hypothetical protein